MLADHRSYQFLILRMSNIPNRTSYSRHENQPLPPIRPAVIGRMTGLRPDFSPRSTHSEKACLPNGISSTIRRASPCQSHALEQIQSHYDYRLHEYQPARQEKVVESNMKSAMKVMFDSPPPGMYPNDVTVPRRPPMIKETTIREYKERNLGEFGDHGKDIHRHLRVVHVIGEFIREHNERYREDPYMHYRWYDSEMTSNKIAGTLFTIIEDTAHAMIPHLYSRFTYSDAQRADCERMESMVARVASNEMFDPLTKTLRIFGIRRLIQDKMATKKKTTDRRQKRNLQNEQLKVKAQMSTVPQNDEANLTFPDLPLAAREVSDSAGRALAMGEIRCKALDTLLQHERNQKQLTEIHSVQPQLLPDLADIQKHALRVSEQATELKDVDTSPKLPSADYDKSPRKARSKANKLVSGPTKSKPSKIVRPKATPKANEEQR